MEPFCYAYVFEFTTLTTFQTMLSYVLSVVTDGMDGWLKILHLFSLFNCISLLAGLPYFFRYKTGFSPFKEPLNIYVSLA